MALALATKQLPSAWAREDPADIATAIQLIQEAQEE